VPLAAQSILRRLPIDTPHSGVVGEIVVRFQERADWCSHLKAIDREIYDLVLRPARNQTLLVACLEEVAGRLRVTRGEQGGPEGLAS
jgi:hypothetical protein